MARPLLGTLVAIDVDRPAGGDRALQAAFERIERIHDAMSFHQPDSDLRRLARAGAGELLRLAPDTHAVLRLAQRVEVESAGAFNACCASSLVARGLLPAPEMPAEAHSLVEALELLDDGEHVRVRARPWIDLGGIAKGYAVDRAVEVLHAAGMAGGVVNAGGDLRVFGTDRTLTVRVRNPREPAQALPVAELTELACATTAWALDKDAVRRTDHLIRPSAALDENAPMSVTVFAPSCAVADALTKVVWLRGVEARAQLQSHEASAFVWRADGSSLRL